MADVVNLRQARKRKARTAKDQKATENRAKYGRTAQEKGRDSATAAVSDRRLDQHKIDRIDDRRDE